jgi:hypothetical protein
MFVIHLASSVRIGGTVDCRINRKPARVTWRDAETLVIEPEDARHIVQVLEHPEFLSFVCADADGSTDFDIITGTPGETHD